MEEQSSGSQSFLIGYMCTSFKWENESKAICVYEMRELVGSSEQLGRDKIMQPE